MAQDDCIFCQIVAGEAPATIVDSDEATVAFMDINPATRGHTLVVPRAHYADLAEIPDDELATCVQAARRLAERAVERLETDGVNLGLDPMLWPRSAGSWPGYVFTADPLRLPWTPGPGDPDEIAGAAARLRDE